MAVSSLGLSQQQLQSLLEPFSQTRQSILQHRHALEEMLFVRRRGRDVNAHRWWLHNYHQAGAAALTELLPERICRPAFLTKMTDCSLHRKKCFVLCLLFSVSRYFRKAQLQSTKHKERSTKCEVLVFVESAAGLAAQPSRVNVTLQ